MPLALQSFVLNFGQVFHFPRCGVRPYLLMLVIPPVLFAPFLPRDYDEGYLHVFIAWPSVFFVPYEFFSLLFLGSSLLG